MYSERWSKLRYLKTGSKELGVTPRGYFHQRKNIKKIGLVFENLFRINI